MRTQHDSYAQDLRRVTSANAFALYRWVWKQRDEYGEEAYFPALLEEVRSDLIADSGVTPDRLDEILSYHIEGYQPRTMTEKN